MKSNLILIEGLPGSGKSTFAKRLAKDLELNGNKVSIFNEGDLHPVDLAWCSVMDKDVFDTYLEKYSKVKDDIIKNTKEINGKMITAFTKVKVDKDLASFYKDFENYEIYRTDSLEYFKNEHLKLWKNLNSTFDKETIYIFECVYLQNHINELIMKHNLNEDQMINYFKDLIESVNNLNPTLVYINQLDIKTTLNSIIEERRTDNPEMFKDWIDLVIEYLESQNYAKELGYIGLDGVYNYFKDRNQHELKIINELNINKIVAELNQDYDSTYKTILDKISNLF